MLCDVMQMYLESYVIISFKAQRKSGLAVEMLFNVEVVTTHMNVYSQWPQKHITHCASELCVFFSRHQIKHPLFPLHSFFIFIGFLRWKWSQKDVII